MDNRIKNTSEISLEKLIELKDRGVKNICMEINHDNVTYDIDTFIQIKKKIVEYTEKIPQIPLDDPDREKKIFTYLYIKVAQNIEYDDFAAKCTTYGGYQREMSQSYVEDASSLTGGLLKGKSICRGYSEILKNLLSEVGIQSVVVSGGGKTIGDHMPSHSWNQVFLDGKWYNCDITNDADFINAGLKLPFFLKSNEEFGEDEMNRYRKYPPKNPEVVQLAEESIIDEKQEVLLLEQKQIIMNERVVEECNENHNSFIHTLAKFFYRFRRIEKEEGVDR